MNARENGDHVSPQKRSATKYLSLGLLRFFFTVGLSALYYLAIRLHQGRILTAGQKSTFDAIIVAISLALSLNVASSLREVAIHAKRWFQEKRHAYVKEIEVHSFLALLGLLRRTPIWALRITCAVWLVLNLAIQVGISVVNLTFKADPGIQDIYLDSNIGMIAIPDMSRFARVGRFNDGARPQSVAAHILGDIGTSYEYSTLPLEPITDAPIAKHPFSFWNAGDHWKYTFTKSAPVPGPRDFNFLSVYSDQSVRSSATCQTPPYNFTIEAATLVIRRTDVQDKTVLFPSLPLGDESMCYLAEPALKDGQANSTGTCGHGCSTVHVVEPRSGEPVDGSQFANPDSPFYYYECNITVKPEQEHAGQFNFLPTSAAVAAQAIALSGQRAPSQNANFSTNQYATYTLGLEFGMAQNNNATAMGFMLSRFAIGVVAAAAQTNPKLLVLGNPPRQGVRLLLDKPVVFVVILCAIAGVQLSLMLAAELLVRSVGLPRTLLADHEIEEEGHCQ